MKRRIFCAVMTVVLVLTMLPVVVGAEGGPAITFDPVVAEDGKTVSVTVGIANNPGLVTATIPVKWDKDVLTLTDVEASTAVFATGFCGMTMEEYAANGTQGVYYLAWDNDTKEDGDFTGNGALAVMTFDVVEGKSGKTAVNSMSADIANLMDFYMKDHWGEVSYSEKEFELGTSGGEDEPDDPGVDPNVYFTYKGKKDIVVKPGESFDLEIVLQNVEPVNSIAISNYTVGSELVSYDGNAWLLNVEGGMGQAGANAVYGCENNIDMNTKVMKLSFTAGTLGSGVREQSTTFTCTVAVRDAEADSSENVYLKVDIADIIVRDYKLGDFNKDDKVNTADAIWLLQHTFFPDTFPVDGQDVDYNNDNKVNTADAIWLLQHTFFPDVFPLE